jgi:hypothetical protein
LSLQKMALARQMSVWGEEVGGWAAACQGVEAALDGASPCQLVAQTEAAALGERRAAAAAMATCRSQVEGLNWTLC